MPKELARWPHSNTCRSIYRAQTSGVPQGPTVGPILFIIFSKETQTVVSGFCPSSLLWWDSPWSAGNWVMMWTCWSKSRAALQCRKAVRAVTVQRGEEQALGRPYCSLSVTKKGLWGSDRGLLLGSMVMVQRAVVLNLKGADLDWIKGRNSLQSGWWDTGRGCSRKMWMSHHWKCSRSGGTELRRTWSSGKHPCSLQGGWNEMIFKGPFQPKPLHQTILQKKESGPFWYLMN